MMKIALTLCFKGERNYLHPSDFYHALCEQLPQALAALPLPPFRMIIHQFARKQCDLLLAGSNPVSGRPERLVAEFDCFFAAGRMNGWLVETDRLVEGRYVYDESRIESLSTIADNSIMIAEESGYTPIEVAVSLTRRLHYSLYPTKGRWIFSRIDLDRFFRPEDARAMIIRLNHNFNNRLTRSSIEAAGEVVGRICFSRVEI